MLRSVRRELTLCEHRASRPDRHGKPAIYSLHVERLVERIGDAG